MSFHCENKWEWGTREGKSQKQRHLQRDGGGENLRETIGNEKTLGKRVRQ